MSHIKNHSFSLEQNHSKESLKIKLRVVLWSHCRKNNQGNLFYLQINCNSMLIMHVIRFIYDGRFTHYYSDTFFPHWDTPGRVHGLLLALHSGIIPGGAHWDYMRWLAPCTASALPMALPLQPPTSSFFKKPGFYIIAA